MESQLAGDEITRLMAEGQCLGISLTKGGIVSAHGLRQRVGLMQHLPAEIDPIDPPGMLRKLAREEPGPACHLSDARPCRRTRQTDDQL